MQEPHVNSNQFDLEDYCNFSEGDEEDHFLDEAYAEPWDEEPVLFAVDSGVDTGSKTGGPHGPDAMEGQQVMPDRVTPFRNPPTSVPVGRWLHGKQHANGTPYSNIIPLGTKQESLIRKRKVDEIKIANAISVKRARIQAIGTLCKNRQLLNEMVDNHGMPGLGDDSSGYDYSTTDRIHRSHTLKPKRENPNALYCDRCGAWYIGGPIEILKEECKGTVPQSRAFQHRILQLGMVPRPGARIPVHCKRR